MKTSRYPAQVYWSDEDKGYVALAPDLPGCSAFGATRAKALSALEHAIEASIKAAQAAGNPVPEPSRVPEPSSANGKVLVRLPKTLHAELLQTAKREQTSLNQYIVSALTAATTAHSLQRFITHHLSSASELTTRAWPVSVSFPENSPQRGITGWITGLAPGTAVTPIRGTHTHIASGTAGTVTYTARTADIRSRLPKLIEVMKEGQHG